MIAAGIDVEFGNATEQFKRVAEMSTNLLILYYSRDGSVERMAKLIGRGVGQVADCESTIRRVAQVSSSTEAFESEIPDSGHAYASRTDLERCDGLALGSPTRFGAMSAPMKYFLDCSASVWLSGSLSGKPAAVFTSSGSMHGGQESTLLSMAVPLLHHGMMLVGIPYTERALRDTESGGTPYGASHVSGHGGDRAFTRDEEKLCLALGRRLAETAKALKAASAL